MLTKNHHNGQIKQEAFAADITLTVQIADEHLLNYKNKLVELTRGAIEFIVIEHADNSLMPFNRSNIL
jgi:hypothetical protein